MTRIANSKKEQCIHMEFFSQLTDGSYQKRCRNAADFRVRWDDTDYRLCESHAIDALKFYEGSRVSEVLDPARIAREARLQELHSMPYHTYLQTPEWKERRLLILERDGYRCQICNSPDRLNVHHRDYTRRGYENDTDLTTLCQGCHQVFHENSRLVRIEA